MIRPALIKHSYSNYDKFTNHFLKLADCKSFKVYGHKYSPPPKCYESSPYNVWCEMTSTSKNGIEYIIHIRGEELNSLFLLIR